MVLYQIIEFIFSSVWWWLGAVIILETIFGGLRGLIRIAGNHEKNAP